MCVRERDGERERRGKKRLRVHVCEKKEGRRRMTENGDIFWVECSAWLGLMNRNLIAVNDFPSVMALKPGSACN